MVKFSEVVAVSRDAQLRQSEREQNDRAFVEDVMDEVRTQVEADGGSLTVQGDWARLNENATNTYQLRFPDGCNVEEVGLTVAGRVMPKKKVFMVGPSGRSPEPNDVQDRAQAVNLVMTYLMEVVMDVRRLHEQ